MPDIERNPFDLSHFIHTCGKIGRVQTLAYYPTVPGDSLEISLDGMIRMAPLRKEVVQESQVDICAFWVPNRHVYPDWPTIVQDGLDGDKLAGLPTLALPANARNPCYLLQPYAPASLPALLHQGYNMIWERYYRVPSLNKSADFDDYPSTDTPDDKDWRLYGKRAARLKHPTNLGLRQSGGATSNQSWRDLDTQDWTVEVPVSGPNAMLDLRAFEAMKGRFRSEIERTWFSERYQDILERQWGSRVNIDADERPELVWHETFRLGGHDVDGTADATLGQYTGKTAGGFRVDIPRRHFAEHGMVWVLALVRWPTIHIAERHPLTKVATWTPEKVLGDPDVYATQAPAPVNWTDYLAEGYASGVNAGELREAFGNMYRVQPNFVHRNFADIPGYPFVRFNASDLTYKLAVYYFNPGEYDDVFQTSQLAHWQLHCRADVQALRYVPDPRMSIFAGAE